MNRTGVHRLMRAIGTFAGYAVAAVVCGLLALNILVPRLTGTVPLTVFTGSMSPGMPAGSMVFVDSVQPEQVAVGDVITFETGPQTEVFITHRVVKIDDSGEKLSFTTKGDANPGQDVKPVPAAAVRGIVKFHVPYVGGISDQLRSATVVASTLGLGALGWLVSMVVTRWRKRRSESLVAPAVEPVGTPDADIAPAPQWALMLVAVAVTSRRESTAALLGQVQACGGRIVGIDDSVLTLMFAAAPAHLDAVLAELSEQWRVIDHQRSGPVAIITDPEAAGETHANQTTGIAVPTEIGVQVATGVRPGHDLQTEIDGQRLSWGATAGSARAGQEHVHVG